MLTCVTSPSEAQFIGDIFLEWIEKYQEYALFIVPTIAFLEACLGIGLFISGAILLSVCTVLYTQGIATLSQMLPLAFLGATIADHSGYYIGRWIGPKFHHTQFAIKRKAVLDKTETILVKHGEMAIIIGRLMTAIRSVVPLLIGISGLSPARYTLYDLIACTVWTAGLGLLVVGIDGLLG
ncbi:MAG: DedA family protein [Gammaproteobacteria bacterium]